MWSFIRHPSRQFRYNKRCFWSVLLRLKKRWFEHSWVVSTECRNKWFHNYARPCCSALSSVCVISNKPAFNTNCLYGWIERCNLAFGQIISQYMLIFFQYKIMTFVWLLLRMLTESRCSYVFESSSCVYSCSVTLTLEIELCQHPTCSWLLSQAT